MFFGGTGFQAVWLWTANTGILKGLHSAIAAANRPTGAGDPPPDGDRLSWAARMAYSARPPGRKLGELRSAAKPPRRAFVAPSFLDNTPIRWRPCLARSWHMTKI